MARTEQIITNFTSGELSPRILARVDVQRYASGCVTMQNMAVLPHGGAKRRGGFHWVSEVKDSTKTVRLIPFQFNVAQAYVLEFGDSYVRFFTQEGQLLSGGSPYEISSPYSVADLPYLKVAQTGDIMYIAHPDYPIYKLTRLASTSWTLAEAPIVNGPFLDLNTNSSWTVTPSATAGSITLTASQATWTANHVGAFWYLKHGATAGYVEITAYTSSTSVTATVKQTLGGTTATNVWAEGAWSEVQGYPYDVTFFQERLVAAGSDGRPESVWGSVVGDFEDFAAGVNDDDAYIYELLTDQVNVLRWVSSQQHAIAAGSGGAEFTLRGNGDNQPITPTSVISSEETTWGSADVKAIKISSETLFVTRSQRKVRALQPGFGLDRPVARDLTFISEHITAGSIVEMTYAQDPDSIIWCVRGDGALIGATYEPVEQVLGWHRHLTDGEVESIAVIPYGEVSQLWACIKRTINGTTKRYIEFLDQDLNTDAALTYSGSATTTLSGADHLIGKTVKVKADGAEHPDVVVDGSGGISLDYAASDIELGLAYESKLKPVRLEGGNPGGTSQGQLKHWSDIFVRLVESAIPLINGQQDPPRSAQDNMDEAPPLVSGDVSIIDDQGWNRDGYIEFTHSRPLPLHIVGVFGTLEVEHGG